MIGIVAGIFCTLIVAWTCSYAFELDEGWYLLLNMPSFMLPEKAFAPLVGVAYASSILAISRLVEHKHIFPSMLFFCGLGASCILFVITFFRLKQLVWGLVFMGAAYMFALILFFRFLIKDIKIAIEFLPAFLFDHYCFIVTLYVATMN